MYANVYDILYCTPSLVNQTLYFAGCLSIGDYKCPLGKGLVNCLYLFCLENQQFVDY